MAPPARRWLALAASILCILAADLHPTRAAQSELLVDGQWSQVSKYWPIEDRDFFIATDKGHHYVQARLPQGLSHDLEVTLEYYYSYSKTKPVMQMIPCLENIFLEHEDLDNKNKWVTNKMIVKQADCRARNELAYNVILHDAGDVFAWRKIEIKQVKQQQQQPQPPATQTTISEPRSEVKPSSQATVIKPPVQTKPVAEPTTRPTSGDPVANPSSKELDSNFNLPELFKKNVIKSSSESKKSQEKTDSKETDRQAQNVVPAGDKKTKSTDGKAADPNPGSSSESKAAPEKVASNVRTSARDDFPIEARPVLRLKRETSPRTQTQARTYEATCKPSSCNRNQFRMKTFSVLVRGLPQLSAEDKRRLSDESAKFLVNLKNQALKLSMRDGSEPIEDFDTCLDLQLYMEANTKIQLLLKDDSDPNKDALLLETIKREPGDSTAGRWDQFKRCISDYMPKFRPTTANSNQNSLTFILKPVCSNDPGQMAVLLDKQKSGSFRGLYPVQNFLPDLKQIQHSDGLNKFWVLDRDGLEKPNVELVEKSGSKLLKVTQIDPSQSSFDLTSRWMQIKDAEILEQPLIFVYRAERVDWIERIDFQYQRAGHSAEEWLSQLVYEANKVGSGNTNNGASSQQTPPAETQPETTQRPAAKVIDLPITVKGADSSEFRIRVRHHLKKSAASSAASTSSQPEPEPLALGIKSLAFADVCSYGRPYCKNKAPCRPTGAAQAECVCETGFSGHFCEQVRPCEVLYDVPDETSIMSGTAKRSVNGHSLCGSMNSTCIEHLPVLRCEWANDQFYQCKKLFKIDSSGDVYSTVSGQKIDATKGQGGPASSEAQQPATDDLDPEGQLQVLKKELDEKTKSIIILSVFLVALLVFAVVLVGSMVSRLRTSSSRLRNTRNELQDLSRRQLPSARPAFNSRAQASAPRAYNNSAFDVEL